MAFKAVIICLIFVPASSCTGIAGATSLLKNETTTIYNI